MKELRELILASKGVQIEVVVKGAPSVPREHWHPAYTRFVEAIIAAEKALVDNTALRLAGELAELFDAPDLLKRIDADAEEATLRIETFKILYKKSRDLKEALDGRTAGG